MNRQEVFNVVWERAKDKHRAEDSDGDCLYRTEDGRACFVGALIKDEEYTFKLEHVALSRRTLKDDYPFPQWMKDDPDFWGWFLGDLQGIHDSQNPEDWEDKLRDFARREGLEVPSEA